MTVKLWVTFVVVVAIFFLGLKGVLFRKNKSDYTMSINLLLGSSILLLGFIGIYFYKSEIIFLTFMCMSFIIEGLHGIINKKYIKSALFNSFSSTTLYFGLFLIIPIIMYFFGYFDK